MTYILLLWFPLAAIAEYVLSVQSSDIRSPLKKLVYWSIMWPNGLVRAAQSLYGKHSYRFPRIHAITNWFKA